MNGIEAFTAERRRQTDELGHTAAHDDGYQSGELMSAAIAYANYALAQVMLPDDPVSSEPPPEWPWDASEWHPSLLAKRNIRKAGALLAAEFDRLDRAGN